MYAFNVIHALFVRHGCYLNQAGLFLLRLLRYNEKRADNGIRKRCRAPRSADLRRLRTAQARTKISRIQKRLNLLQSLEYQLQVISVLKERLENRKRSRSGIPIQTDQHNCLTGQPRVMTQRQRKCSPGVLRLSTRPRRPITYLQEESERQSHTRATVLPQSWIPTKEADSHTATKYAQRGNENGSKVAVFPYPLRTRVWKRDPQTPVASLESGDGGCDSWTAVVHYPKTPTEETDIHTHTATNSMLAYLKRPRKPSEATYAHKPITCVPQAYDRLNARHLSKPRGETAKCTVIKQSRSAQHNHIHTVETDTVTPLAASLPRRRLMVRWSESRFGRQPSRKEKRGLTSCRSSGRQKNNNHQRSRRLSYPIARLQKICCSKPPLSRDTARSHTGHRSRDPPLGHSSDVSLFNFAHGPYEGETRGLMSNLKPRRFCHVCKRVIHADLCSTVSERERKEETASTDSSLATPTYDADDSCCLVTAVHRQREGQSSNLHVCPTPLLQDAKAVGYPVSAFRRKGDGNISRLIVSPSSGLVYPTPAANHRGKLTTADDKVSNMPALLCGGDGFPLTCDRKMSRGQMFPADLSRRFGDNGVCSAIPRLRKAKHDAKSPDILGSNVRVQRTTNQSQDFPRKDKGERYTASSIVAGRGRFCSPRDKTAESGKYCSSSHNSTETERGCTSYDNDKEKEGYSTSHDDATGRYQASYDNVEEKEVYSWRDKEEERGKRSPQSDKETERRHLTSPAKTDRGKHLISPFREAEEAEYSFSPDKREERRKYAVLPNKAVQRGSYTFLPGEQVESEMLTTSPSKTVERRCSFSPDRRVKTERHSPSTKTVARRTCSSSPGKEVEIRKNTSSPMETIVNKRHSSSPDEEVESGRYMSSPIKTVVKRRYSSLDKAVESDGYVSSAIKTAERCSSSPDKEVERGRYTGPPNKTQEGKRYSSPPDKEVERERYTTSPNKTLQRERYSYSPGEETESGRYISSVIRTSERRHSFPPDREVESERYIIPPNDTLQRRRYSYSPDEEVESGRYTSSTTRTVERRHSSPHQSERYIISPNEALQRRYSYSPGEEVASGRHTFSTIRTVERRRHSSSPDKEVESERYIISPNETLQRKRYSFSPGEEPESGRYTSSTAKTVMRRRHSSPPDREVESERYIISPNDTLQRRRYSYSPGEEVENGRYTSSAIRTSERRHSSPPDREVENERYIIPPNDTLQRKRYPYSPGEEVESGRYTSSAIRTVKRQMHSSLPDEEVESERYSISPNKPLERRRHSSSPEIAVESERYVSSLMKTVEGRRYSSSPDEAVDRERYASSSIRTVDRMKYSSSIDKPAKKDWYANSSAKTVEGMRFLSSPDEEVQSERDTSSPIRTVESRKCSFSPEKTVAKERYTTSPVNTVDKAVESDRYTPSLIKTVERRNYYSSFDKPVEKESQASSPTKTLAGRRYSSSPDKEVESGRYITSPIKSMQRRCSPLPDKPDMEGRCTTSASDTEGGRKYSSTPENSVKSESFLFSSCKGVGRSQRYSSSPDEADESERYGSSPMKKTERRFSPSPDTVAHMRYFTSSDRGEELHSISHNTTRERRYSTSPEKEVNRVSTTDSHDTIEERRIYSSASHETGGRRRYSPSPDTAIGRGVYSASCEIIRRMNSSSPNKAEERARLPVSCHTKVEKRRCSASSNKAVNREKYSTPPRKAAGRGRHFSLPNEMTKMRYSSTPNKSVERVKFPSLPTRSAETMTYSALLDTAETGSYPTSTDRAGERDKLSASRSNTMETFNETVDRDRYSVSPNRRGESGRFSVSQNKAEDRVRYSSSPDQLGKGSYSTSTNKAIDSGRLLVLSSQTEETEMCSTSPDKAVRRRCSASRSQTVERGKFSTVPETGKYSMSPGKPVERRRYSTSPIKAIETSCDSTLSDKVLETEWRSTSSRKAGEGKRYFASYDENMGKERYFSLPDMVERERHSVSHGKPVLRRKYSDEEVKSQTTAVERKAGVKGRSAALQLTSMDRQRSVAPYPRAAEGSSVSRNSTVERNSQLEAMKEECFSSRLKGTENDSIFYIPTPLSINDVIRPTNQSAKRLDDDVCTTGLQNTENTSSVPHMLVHSGVQQPTSSSNITNDVTAPLGHLASNDVTTQQDVCDEAGQSMLQAAGSVDMCPSQILGGTFFVVPRAGCHCIQVARLLTTHNLSLTALSLCRQDRLKATVDLNNKNKIQSLLQTTHPCLTESEHDGKNCGEQNEAVRLPVNRQASQNLVSGVTFAADWGAPSSSKENIDFSQTKNNSKSMYSCFTGSKQQKEYTHESGNTPPDDDGLAKQNNTVANTNQNKLGNNDSGYGHDLENSGEESCDFDSEEKISLCPVEVYDEYKPLPRNLTKAGIDGVELFSAADELVVNSAEVLYKLDKGDKFAKLVSLISSQRRNLLISFPDKDTTNVGWEYYGTGVNEQVNEEGSSYIEGDVGEPEPDNASDHRQTKAATNRSTVLATPKTKVSTHVSVADRPPSLLPTVGPYTGLYTEPSEPHQQGKTLLIITPDCVQGTTTVPELNCMSAI